MYFIELISGGYVPLPLLGYVRPKEVLGVVVQVECTQSYISHLFSHFKFHHATLRRM